MVSITILRIDGFRLFMSQIPAAPAAQVRLCFAYARTRPSPRTLRRRVPYNATLRATPTGVPLKQGIGSPQAWSMPCLARTPVCCHHLRANYTPNAVRARLQVLQDNAVTCPAKVCVSCVHERKIDLFTLPVSCPVLLTIACPCTDRLDSGESAGDRALFVAPHAH